MLSEPIGDLAEQQEESGHRFTQYGSTSNWPEDWEHRFRSLRSKLATYFLNPEVAWRPHERVRLGATNTRWFEMSNDMLCEVSLDGRFTGREHDRDYRLDADFYVAMLERVLTEGW